MRAGRSLHEIQDIIRTATVLSLERDMLEISNFRIRLEDFNERDVAADVTEINFEDPIFVGDGRYLTATVNIKNTGSAPLLSS